MLVAKEKKLPQPTFTVLRCTEHNRKMVMTLVWWVFWWEDGIFMVQWRLSLGNMLNCSPGNIKLEGQKTFQTTGRNINIPIRGSETHLTPKAFWAAHKVNTETLKVITKIPHTGYTESLNVCSYSSTNTEKSRIRETLNLLTDGDSITIAIKKFQIFQEKTNRQQADIATYRLNRPRGQFSKNKNS